MSTNVNNTAMKLNDKPQEEEINKDSKKSLLERTADRLLKMDAAKKNKAAAKEAKKAKKKEKKEAKNNEAESDHSSKKKLAIACGALGVVTAIGIGSAIGHHSGKDDLDLDEIESEEEDEEESLEEEITEETEETTEEE